MSLEVGRRLALMGGATVLAVATVAVGGDPSRAIAQESAGAQADLETMRVQGNVHVVVGAGANITVQTGPLGVVVVDTGLPQHSDRVLAAIRTLSNRSIRFVINTHAHPDHAGANEQLAAAGTPVSGRGVAVVGAGQTSRAEIVAYELVLHRMSGTSGEAPTPAAAWPTTTFSYPQKEFFTNGEGIQIVHQPAAHTDGDSIVFFRRSDVISAGDVFSTTSYPVIDLEHGGTIQGFLAAVNRLIEIAIPDVDQQGGTLIVPGHGRLSDEMDVVEYRDMVTIVRDRIADMIDGGSSLAAVQAARPTFEFDARYGAERGSWTTSDFVAAVYASLSAPR